MKEKIKKIITFFFAFFYVLTTSFADSYVHVPIKNLDPPFISSSNMEKMGVTGFESTGNYLLFGRRSAKTDKGNLFTFYEYTLVCFKKPNPKVQVLPTSNDGVFRLLLSDFNDGDFTAYHINYDPLEKKYNASGYGEARAFYFRDTEIGAIVTQSQYGIDYSYRSFVKFQGNFKDIKDIDDVVGIINNLPPESSPQGTGEGLTKYLPMILEFLVWFLSSLLGLHLSLKLLRRFINISR